MKYPVSNATGCYYELPDEVSIDEMKGYERWAKGTFSNYKCRRSRRLYFEFKTPKDRDSFLAAMEKTLVQQGTPYKRIILP